MSATQPGANDWIERISTRGWAKLNLDTAGGLIDEGQASVNLVAAIPSLHAGLSAAIAIFLWRRVRRRWRPLLVAYPLIMAFTLVYSAEHYVIDILLGWALAVIVVFALNIARMRGSPETPPVYPPDRADRFGIPLPAWSGCLLPLPCCCPPYILRTGGGRPGDRRRSRRAEPG